MILKINSSFDYLQFHSEMKLAEDLILKCIAVRKRIGVESLPLERLSCMDHVREVHGCAEEE